MLHNHKFKRLHRIENWARTSDSKFVIGYDEWVNICECGEERKVKTKPRGIWKRSNGGRVEIEKVSLYPSRWNNLLRLLLKSKIKEKKDIEFRVNSVLRLSGLSWSELEKFINVLLSDGIIETFEQYSQKRSNDGAKILFRSDVVESLKDTLELNKDKLDLDRIQLFFDTWEYPDNLMNDSALQIAKVIDGLKDLWEGGNKAKISENQSMKSLSNYSLLLETLREIYNLVLLGESIGFRELSVRVTGDSKGLELIKYHLNFILGDLSNFGVIEHSPLISCKVPVIGKIGGKVIDLSACSDYVSITASTARMFDPINSSMDVLILIENLTSFEKFTRELGSEKAKKTGVIFLSGYPPGHIREFVLKLLAYRPFKGLIWCDLDPNGVDIALTVAKWFKDGNWDVIFMDESFLSSSRTKPLEEHDFELIEKLKGGNIENKKLSLLLKEIEKRKVKVEQEAQSTSLSSLI